MNLRSSTGTPFQVFGLLTAAMRLPRQRGRRFMVATWPQPAYLGHRSTHYGIIVAGSSEGPCHLSTRTVGGVQLLATPSYRNFG